MTETTQLGLWFVGGAVQRRAERVAWVLHLTNAGARRSRIVRISSFTDEKNALKSGLLSLWCELSSPSRQKSRIIPAGQRSVLAPLLGTFMVSAPLPSVLA